MKYIYLNTLLIVISLSLTNCNAQEKITKSTSCKENIIITYDETGGDYNSIELPKNIKDNFNWVTIEFFPGIKAPLEVYLNNEYLNVKGLEGASIPNSVFYKYKNGQVNLFLKSLDKNSCLNILLDKEYNLVKLNKVDNQWKLEYSGYYEIVWQ